MKILILNQTFHPDVVSTAQHARDLALELAARNHDVCVLCSGRAYDDPRVKFRQQEIWRGIRITRIPCLGFGKGSKLKRLLVLGSFLAGCVARLACTPPQDRVIAMTSPPLASLLAALFVRLKGGRLVCWVMDLNPDEAIAAGWLRANSLLTRGLQALMNYSLQAAETVIVLDRFMKARIVRRGISEKHLAVIPPWSHDRTVTYDRVGRETFRSMHGLAGKFVVMYAGNHSPCHPLDTLLAAAYHLRDHNNIAFCFVGGGTEFPRVKAFASERDLQNVTCLPYQPFEKLSSSLSAADLQVVVLGNPFVGIVHPCKVYNILALSIPLLYIGPSPSHITELLREVRGADWAHVAQHGAVDAVIEHVLKASQQRVCSDAGMTIGHRFSQELLLPCMSQAIESGSVQDDTTAGHIEEPAVLAGAWSTQHVSQEDLDA